MTEDDQDGIPRCLSYSSGQIVALAVVVWGAFPGHDGSIAVVVVAAVVALIAAGCGWYAGLPRAQSLPWTIGYGVVVLLSVGVGMKHGFGSRDKSGG